MRAFPGSPGVVSGGGVSGGVEIGGLAGVDHDVVGRIVGILQQAGLGARFRRDIWTALWEKLIVVCVTGGVMASERSTLGPVLATGKGRERVRQVIEEAVAVAVAGGVPLSEDASARAFEFVSKRVEPDATSSMLEDVRAGRRLELEWINGEIVRRAREHGISTPANLAICEALEPYVRGSGAGEEGAVN
jgi:2-dehydropantoate 2-reductase